VVVSVLASLIGMFFGFMLARALLMSRGRA
jgi:hypothetical protein